MYESTILNNLCYESMCEYDTMYEFKIKAKIMEYQMCFFQQDINKCLLFLNDKIKYKSLLTFIVSPLHFLTFIVSPSHFLTILNNNIRNDNGGRLW